MKTTHFILYALLLITSLIIVVLITDKILNVQRETYSIFPYIVYRGLLLIPIGILLGLPRLFSEKMQPGKWKLHYTRFLMLGIPILILTLYPLWHFYVFAFPESISVPLLVTNLFSVFGLIFGYSFISSIYRENTP